MSFNGEPFYMEMLPTLYILAGLYNSILKIYTPRKAGADNKPKERAGEDFSLPEKGAGCQLSQWREYHGLYRYSADGINGM